MSLPHGDQVFCTAHYSNVPKKRVLTLQERLEIVEEVEKNPGEKRVDVAKRLGLATSTLNTIYTNRNKIREHVGKCGNNSKKRKTARESHFAELETILFSWYQQARAFNIPIDGNILREKAKFVATWLKLDGFTASNGWLSRFKDRHSLVYKKLALESAAADFKSAQVSMDEIPDLLAEYEPCDIYNADETALLFNALPDRKLALKGESCHGDKNSMERITVLLCVNSDGSDKLTPLIVGKSRRPRCFKNVKKLPAEYCANTKAWMTADIFSQFLRSLDLQIGAQNRKILLFVDDCTTHPRDTSFLRNVRVVRFPAKCTQPFDLGIIRSFKRAYRKHLIQTAICMMDAAKQDEKLVNILEAMHIVVSAWRQVSREIVFNCFKKVGLVSREGSIAKDSASHSDEEFLNEWEKFTGTAKSTFYEYVNVDADVVTCGVLTLEELCEDYLCAVGEEGVEEEEGAAEIKAPNFTEVHDALMKVKEFVYAHSNQDSDKSAIMELESSIFRLRQVATNQLRIT